LNEQDAISDVGLAKGLEVGSREGCLRGDEAFVTYSRAP
jgi:hypothetical protein